jgi:hypothetical protein
MLHNPFSILPTENLQQSQLLSSLMKSKTQQQKTASKLTKQTLVKNNHVVAFSLCHVAFATELRLTNIHAFIYSDNYIWLHLSL